MTQPDPKRVAAAYLREQATGRTKTAGEVIFRKDRGGDKNEWAWGGIGPSKRDFGPGFNFDPRQLKPLAQTLRSALMGLGHVVSAHSTFVKIKFADISPDGNLGGRGYIQKVADIRRQLMNVSEALSAVTDTLYDEMRAPHWHPDSDDGGPRERMEVQQIMQDVEEVRGDPEGWAEQEEAEMDSDNQTDASPPSLEGKQAFQKVAARYLKRDGR